MSTKKKIGQRKPKKKLMNMKQHEKDRKSHRAIEEFPEEER